MCSHAIVQNFTASDGIVQEQGDNGYVCVRFMFPLLLIGAGADKNPHLTCECTSIVPFATEDKSQLLVGVSGLFCQV